MTDSRPLPRKKDVTLLLLEGPSVYLHLDPRREGVNVPKWLAGQPQLVLQIGLNMPVPIPDLVVDDEGVSCTLSFNRAPFWCKLPWTAIYAVVGADQRGMVWPDDVPPEVAAQLLKSGAPGRPTPPQGTKPQGVPSAKPSPAAKQAASKKPRPTLEALDGGASEKGGSDKDPKEPKGDPELRPERLTPALASVPNEPPEAEEPPPPKQGNGQGKPKRELPPYLRVIK
jgi:hypothetical protein